MSKLFQAATALLATIPGLAILLANMGVPPGYKWLFGAVVEVFGVFSLLALWLYRQQLQSLTKRWLVWSAGGCLAGFVVLLISYLYLQERTLIVSQDSTYRAYGPVYFPIWLSGRLEQDVNKAGSRRAVVDEHGPEAIDKAIDKTPGLSAARTWTTIILLLVYTGMTTLLTLTFGLFECGMKTDNVPSGEAGGPSLPPSVSGNQGR